MYTEDRRDRMDGWKFDGWILGCTPKYRDAGPGKVGGLKDKTDRLTQKSESIRS